MPYSFVEFLKRNSVTQVDPLPLVHTTTSFRLNSIATSQSLTAQECDVFGERLNYFFVGRPAYKTKKSANPAKFWELPCCFVFEYGLSESAKRVFPFDTGAFNKRLMPSYISEMEMKSFDAGSIPNAALKIIGAFFSNSQNYYEGKAKDQAAFEAEFALHVFDHEVRAVHSLCIGEQVTVDDRRMAVELQSSLDIDLTVVKPLAVVAPSPYFEAAEFVDVVLDQWGAEPLPYPVAPLNTEAYYALIYARVHEFYKQKGVI